MKKKILVSYFSKTGNTERMAEFVRDGATDDTVSVELKKIEDTTCEDLLQSDAIIFGSPTYYGLPDHSIIKLIDESVKYHGKLQEKVGAAFTSSGNIGGGNETTIIAILEAFLIHGMIIIGTSSGDHYGPVSIGMPDERVKTQCLSLGKRIKDLVSRI